MNFLHVHSSDKNIHEYCKLQLAKNNIDSVIFVNNISSRRRSPVENTLRNIFCSKMLSARSSSIN